MDKDYTLLRPFDPEQDLPKVAQEQTTTIAAQSAVIEQAKTALDQIDMDVRMAGYADGFESTWALMDKAIAAIDALPEVAEKGGE